MDQGGRAVLGLRPPEKDRLPSRLGSWPCSPNLSPPFALDGSRPEVEQEQGWLTSATVSQLACPARPGERAKLGERRATRNASWPRTHEFSGPAGRPAGTLAPEQVWLTRRLAGLAPGDLGEQPLHVVCLAGLAPPAAFEACWSAFLDEQASPWTMPRAELSTLYAILVFSDPADETHVRRFLVLLEALDALDQDAPPMVWVPHSSTASKRPLDTEVDASEKSEQELRIHAMFEQGLDGIIVGEPAGFRFARVVRATLAKINKLTGNLVGTVNDAHRRRVYTDGLKQGIHCILWEYLRCHVTPTIPPVNHSLPHGEFDQVDGFSFGQMLGRGSFGSVFKIVPLEGGPHAGEPDQVVKIISKEGVKELVELKVICRMIDLMMILSSPAWKHPNVVQLYETYHAPSCILFRMELAGPENLYRRLSHRQRSGPANRPLPPSGAAAIVEQALGAVAHLHLGPRVCHRDLKPENVIVDDREGALIMKLADFDLAVVQLEGATCRGMCGTVPFAAPEVLLEREYDGLSADIWSLGVVLLEVLCGVRVVETVLNLAPPQDSRLPRAPGARGAPPAAAAGGAPRAAAAGGGAPRLDARVADRLRVGFEAPGAVAAVVDQHVRTELRALAPAMKPLLDGMMHVAAGARWHARVLAAWLDAGELPGGAGGGAAGGALCC